MVIRTNRFNAPTFAEAGGRVQFHADAEDLVQMLPKKRSIKTLKGLFPRPEVTVDVNAAIRAETARRNCPGNAD